MIYDKLYNWQKQLVNKYKDKDSWGLFLDCGTGKTPVSLAFAEINDADKILIITINSKAIEGQEVKSSWLDWSSRLKNEYLFKTKKDTNFNKDEKELLIVNYESLYKRIRKEEICDKRGGSKAIELSDEIKSFIKSCSGYRVAIIIDESHKVKDLSSKQYKSVSAIINKLRTMCKKVNLYLLTGTPFTTGYIDIYSQLKLLGCPMNKTEFIEKFCVRGRLKSLTEWQQPIVGYKNVDELYDLIHQYATTIKSEDVVDLPEQVFVEYSLPKTESFDMITNEKVRGIDIVKYAKKLGKTLEDDYNTKSYINNPFYRNLAYPRDIWVAETTGSYWMRCRQASIGFQGNDEECEWFDRSRLNKLKQFLEEHRDNYIIFYNYVPELLEIYDICTELKYNIDVYCGDIKSELYYEKYSKLTDSEKLINKNNVIIANFASGSTGKNWQAYNKCILFSAPLYKDYAQGIKRIHRTGQKENCFFYFFYQNNFLDKGMIDSLKEGVEYNEKIFENNLKSFRKDGEFS